jgi:DNA replication protein DnaC
MMIISEIFKRQLKKLKKNNVADKSVITELELRRLFNDEAIKYYKKFDIDNCNKSYLNLLCKYFSRDTGFETQTGGDLKKGLFVTGNNGTGKTTSFKIIQNISLKFNCKQLWFPIRESNDVVLDYNLNKYKDDVIRKTSKGTMLIDDLGAEQQATNVFVYGKEDIFIRILEARYREFINKGTKTFITTNLNLEEIKKRYGVRVEDRFIEMFNILKLDGKSRR